MFCLLIISILKLSCSAKICIWGFFISIVLLIYWSLAVFFNSYDLSLWFFIFLCFWRCLSRISWLSHWKPKLLRNCLLIIIDELRFFGFIISQVCFVLERGRVREGKKVVSFRFSHLVICKNLIWIHSQGRVGSASQVFWWYSASILLSLV